MPEMPAFCNECGTIFGSGFVVENSRDTTFSGNVVESCPNCGSMGHIPDGVYNVLDGTIELLSGPDKSVAQIKRLASLLREAQKSNMSKTDLDQRLEEEAPEFSSLSKWMPDSPTARYALITLILFFLFNLADQGWKYLEYKESLDQSPNLTKKAIEQAKNKSDEEIDKTVKIIQSTPENIVDEKEKEVSESDTTNSDPKSN